MAKFLLVGGGSGGHLTPLVSVASAIHDIEKSSKIECIGQKGENLREVFDKEYISNVHYISAGKFRRYHGESLWSHLTDFRTIALNIRDFFRFVRGTFQAWRILGKSKPDAIMLKGGFVCVPVGWAARIRGIPYVTHDSDAVPGLANRLTAKNASYNLTALPTDHYPYDKSKTIQVGIPIQPEFKQLSEDDKQKIKSKLGYSKTDKIIFCTGGGLGARNVNDALIKSAKALFENDKNSKIIHITGKKLFEECQLAYQSILDSDDIKRLKLIDFTTELYKYSASADVVLSRAGATNIVEFGVQGKPCIVVPAAHLTGGQQLHNAAILEANNACVVLQENELDQLSEEIIELLEDKNKQKVLSTNISKLAVEDSAEKIANILVRLT